MRESVEIERPVRTERVPDGSPIELEAGTPVLITQALGGSFTLLADGQLVRLRGVDADAIGKPVPETVVVPAGTGDEAVREQVWAILKTCYDPEIPVDIVALGLVYEVDLAPRDGGRRYRVRVRMTLTAPGCGMGEILADEICDKLLALDAVGEATVEVVFDPPWDRSRISEEAALVLGL